MNPAAGIILTMLTKPTSLGASFTTARVSKAHKHLHTRETPTRRYNSLTCLFLLSAAWQNKNDIRVVDIVYDDYAVFHTIQTKDGVTEVLNNLYSKSVISHTTALYVDSSFLVKVNAPHSVLSARSPEPNATLQQKFTQFSLETGILPENIVLLEKNGMSLALI